MPTQKPRIAVTLDAHVRAAVDDLADALQKPASKVVAQLLEEMVPQLEGLAKVARAARSGNKVAAKRALQHMLGDSMAEIITANQADMFKRGK